MLVRGGRLEGRVRHRDGRPFAEGRVMVSGGGASAWPEPAVIGDDGSFVDRLPPGTASVTVMTYGSGPYASPGPGVTPTGTFSIVASLSGVGGVTMRARQVFRHAIAAMAVGLLVACTSVGSRPGVKGPATIDSLVTTEWLTRHLDEPDLVVLDCTVRVERGQDGGLQIVSGRADFERGHIPSAGFADLTSDLADASSRLRFAVPAPAQFAVAMGALGVGDDSRVVLYSATDPGWAARVWWMLRWIGFDRAALLDGGLQAWKAEGRPLSTEPANQPAKRLTVSLRPELIAGRGEVRAAIGNEAVTLVDSLPEASFQGKMAFYGRPGHIAGAINIPATSLVDESGRYLPQEKLAAKHGGDRGRRVITYCGGGIAASSSAFVMTRLGFKNVAVYAASLQEWAPDPANPMEVDTPE